jgi:hypothetical protein
MASKLGAFFWAKTDAKQSSMNGGPTMEAITTETAGVVFDLPIVAVTLKVL